MTPATPLDQLVIDELQRLLQRISTDNGFHTNIGQHVLVEESQAGLGTGVAAIELLDGVEQADYQNPTKRSADLNVTCAVTIPADLDTARADMRLAFADVRRALASGEHHQFPKRVNKLLIGGRRMNPREEGSAFIDGELDIRVTYVEDHLETTP